MLKLNDKSVEAQLLLAEIAIRQNKISEAETQLEALRNLTPPLNPIQRARVMVLQGRALEAQPAKIGEALPSYIEAIQLVGDKDVGPTVAATSLLARQATALETSDPAKAAELRAQADQLLAPLTERAEKDAGLATTLGGAYLDAKNPLKAEQWVRKALASRPNDIEAHFRLAEALRMQERLDESLAMLKKAYDLAPERVDVGLELAREYERRGRELEAGTMYDRLLTGKEVSIDLRGRAGRFFIRQGNFDKAKEQGEAIAAIDAQNPAGQYVRGEVLLNANQTEEARRLFQQAVDADPNPQFFDALGRAAERWAAETGDTRFKDEALRAYTDAVKGDPRIFTSQVGKARLLLDRRDAKGALATLKEAEAIKAGDPEVAYGMGLAYVGLNQRKEAITWLNKSMVAKPRAIAAYRLALLYLDADQGGATVSSLTTAVKLGLEEEVQSGKLLEWLTDAMYTLGQMEYERRNHGAAKRAWNQYIARSPKDQARVDEVKRALALMP